LFLNESEISAGRDLTFTDCDDKREIRRVNETKKSDIFADEAVGATGSGGDEVGATAKGVRTGDAGGGNVYGACARGGALRIGAVGILYRRQGRRRRTEETEDCQD
jgi:hypothetical protein